MTPEWLTTRKITHRGLSNDKLPENSLGAFENAIKYGYPIELDVQIISDGNIIVFHDDTLIRMCNIYKSVYDTKTEDLANHKLLETDYAIPTLTQVLEFIDGKVPLMIEIKTYHHIFALCKKLVEVLKTYKGEFVIVSFNPIALWWLKRHAPEICRGMISSSLKDVSMPKIYKYLIKRLSFFKVCKADFISYDIRDLPNKFVAKKKVPILTWTIKSQEEENSALEIVDNVIFEGYIPSQSHTGV